MDKHLRRRFSLMALTALLLSSCDSYYFSHPQPVDAVALPAFPESFRGTWYSDDRQEIWVEPASIGIIRQDTLRLMKGAWPRRVKGKWLFPDNGFSGFSTIRYNAQQKPMDTTANYLINGRHLYAFRDSTELEQGFHFRESGDSLFVFQTDTLAVDLGNNAQLRQVGEGLYLFNLRNHILGEDNRWWQLFVLEQTTPDTLKIWYCAQGLTHDPSMFYASDHTWYFNSAWTKADLLRLIRAGYFEMCTLMTRYRSQ